MQIDKRLELINFLESIILREDFETFLRKSNKKLAEEDNDLFIKNWYKNSSTFTRMWLSYLSDERLLEILEKKMVDKNVNKNILDLNSRI
ncbi:MAG TPA: hypothetical protein PLE45_00330 [Spirochaetota bacterium]|nr:hypothetical protein [Spirochaetota bacterium]HOL56508.1 hypothetical protein [Spirochaetota bacterium]HPP03950.1 hypothetical protein [Spirochaetota bacterium]